MIDDEWNVSNIFGVVQKRGSTALEKGRGDGLPPGTLNRRGTVFRVKRRMITPMLTTKNATFVPIEDMSLRTPVGNRAPQKAQIVPDTSVATHGV